MVLLLFGFYQAASVFSNVWLSKWTSDATLTNRTIGPPNSTIYRDKNDYYLGIYGGAGALQGISLSRNIWWSWGSSRCFLSRHIWWSFFQIQIRLSKFLEIVLLFFLLYIYFFHFICLCLGYAHDQNRKLWNIMQSIIIRYMLCSVSRLNQEAQSWNLSKYDNFFWHDSAANTAS